MGVPCLVSASQHIVYVLLSPDQKGECQVETSSYRMETGHALIPNVATSISPDGSTAIDVARGRRSRGRRSRAQRLGLPPRRSRRDSSLLRTGSALNVGMLTGLEGQHATSAMRKSSPRWRRGQAWGADSTREVSWSTSSVETQTTSTMISDGRRRKNAVTSNSLNLQLNQSIMNP